MSLAPPVMFCAHKRLKSACVQCKPAPVPKEGPLATVDLFEDEDLKPAKALRRRG